MRTALLATSLALFALACAGTRQDNAGMETPVLGPVDMVYRFDHEFDDVKPRGWQVSTSVPHIDNAIWAVRPDPTAPSPGKVLTLTRTIHTNPDAFNLLWTSDVQFRDGRIECAVRADSGKVDQGGGLAWRVQGKSDYYVCRFNPLESNIRIDFVKNGTRTQLASGEVKTAGGEWHTLRIDHHGKHIVCSLDGKQQLEVDDETFANAGGVGFWTKADACTSFDSLTITKP
jgi:hypothetical protein